MELEDGHFRDSFNAYKQPSLVSIRSTHEERGYDCTGDSSSTTATRHRSTILDYGQGLTGSGSREPGRRHRQVVRQPLEDYSFEDNRRRDRHSHNWLVSSASPLERVSVRVNGGSPSSLTGEWTNGVAHKRSYSEDRLKEG